MTPVTRLLPFLLCHFCFAYGCGLTTGQTANIADAPSAALTTPTLLIPDGGRVAWSPDGTQIAYDRKGSDGYYDVWIMGVDGSGSRCLTCAASGLPQRHNGNPDWHPSGRYLVIQSEKPVHAGPSSHAEPGFGGYSDLWLVDASSGQAQRLTDVPPTLDNGVLHPHFSKDGTRLSWSQRHARPGLLRPFGFWKLMVADLAWTAEQASLEHVTPFEPGGPGFYENHGFSPDGRELLFTSNFEAPLQIRGTDIYRMDLVEQRPIRITEAGAYDEHAGFTKDGERIVWMSSMGRSSPGTDYWVMQRDGSDKQRITDFSAVGCPTGSTCYAADLSIAPDDRAFVGYVQNDLVKQTGATFVVPLPAAAPLLTEHTEYEGFVTGGRTQSYPIDIYRLQSETAPQPLFIYTPGTGGRYDADASPEIAKAMARRGFVAASVDYDNELWSVGFLDCERYHKKAASIYDIRNPSSAVSVLCKRAGVDCTLGVVVAGLSQGGSVAVLARDYNPDVRAAFVMGAFPNAKRLSYKNCLEPSFRDLPSDGLRIVNGSHDALSESVRQGTEALSGYTCAPDATSCLQDTGAGWLLVPDAATQDGDADHCYMFIGGCLGHNHIDSGWLYGSETWQLGPNLDWLAARAGTRTVRPGME